MDIADRLNEIIKHEGLSVAGFARRIGIGDQTVRGVVVMRRNNPGYDFLQRVAQTFEWLNVDWLLTGRGSMQMSKSVNGGGVIPVISTP